MKPSEYYTNISNTEQQAKIPSGPQVPSDKPHETTVQAYINKLKEIERDIGMNAPLLDARANIQERLKSLEKNQEKLQKLEKLIDDTVADVKNVKDVLNTLHSPTETIVIQANDLRELDRLWSDLEKQFLDPNSSYNKTIGNHGRNEPNTNVQKQDNISSYMQGNQNMKVMKVKDGWFTEADGTKKHYVNGELHSAYGDPAEIRPNGTSLWYTNGKLHRDGGQPAMIGVNGTYKYAVDGKYHRLGGLPAIIWSKSPYREEWWENGEILRAVKKDGTKEWYAPGATSRDEARYHNENGPAVLHPNGKEEYWLNGQHYADKGRWLATINSASYVARSTLKAKPPQVQLQPTLGITEEDTLEHFEKTTKEELATPKSQKAEKKMKKNFAEIIKENAVSAGYRVAGTQASTLVKNSILTLMRNKGSENSAIQAVSAFLDTEFGTALISFAIGSGLHYVPHFNEDPRVERLGEEMRTEGMATAGNAIIGEAMGHILPALSEILQKLPAVENTESNIRVEEAKEHKLAEALEEEVVEEVAKKTMKV